MLNRSELVDVAISKGRGGHRDSYLSVCSDLLDLNPYSSQDVGFSLINLFFSKRLLFVTLDDHWVTFFVVASIRSAFHKKTAGLLLRGPSLLRSNRWIDRIKCRALEVMQRSNAITVVSIVPYNLIPKLSSITKLWVHDLQMWDLTPHNSIKVSELSQHIKMLAKGRKLIIFIGQVARFKGIEVLRKLYVDDILGSDFLVVVAGHINEDCKDICKQIENNGGVVIGRFLTDSEIESLYYIATFVWCAYSEEYDQASGIFGRAVQLGIPAIIRKGSLIEKYAKMLGVRSFVNIDFDRIELLQGEIRNHCMINELIANEFNLDSTPNVWRQDFVQKMRKCL